MKKIVFVLLTLLLCPFVNGIAQEKEVAEVSSDDKLKVTVGLNYGFNNNINAYRLSPDDDGNTYYGEKSGFSVGADFGIPFSKKFRTRIGVRYSEMEYGMDWDNTSSFNKTITHLYNFDLNLHFDYLIASSNNLKLFISPGIMSEFVMDADFKNEKVDGDYTYRNYFLKQYPESVAGGNLSLLAIYKINKFMSLTLSPGYTYFFREFSSVNDKPYQRLNVNVGLEFDLF